VAGDHIRRRRHNTEQHLHPADSKARTSANRRPQRSAHLHSDHCSADCALGDAAPRATIVPQQASAGEHHAASTKCGPGHTTYARDLAAGISGLEVVAAFIRVCLPARGQRFP